MLRFYTLSVQFRKSLALRLNTKDMLNNLSSNDGTSATDLKCLKCLVWFCSIDMLLKCLSNNKKCKIGTNFD